VQYLEAEACLHFFCKNLGDYAIEVLKHLDSDLRRHLALGHEVVKSVCEGVTETEARMLVKVTDDPRRTSQRRHLPATAVQLIVLGLVGGHVEWYRFSSCMLGGGCQSEKLRKRPEAFMRVPAANVRSSSAFGFAVPATKVP
jgi:hypothetical protein